MSIAHVLVVDDDHWIREALNRILVKAGYSVEQAATGEAALELAKESQFDVALCDFRLPGIDGVTCLKQLRDSQSACSRILMTGMLDVPTVVSAVNTAAISRALQKPLKPKELVSAVEEALSARTRDDDARSSAERESERKEREELRAVIAGDYLGLALQPLVNANDELPHGYEALLRSSHPVFDSPATVLPAVERHGLVSELADKVAMCAETWLRKMEGTPSLFLNLHPQELAVPEELWQRLERLRPWADRVVLEITERSALENVPEWNRAVRGAVERGFSIAIDDLGSGYNSLSTMADLQPQYIKIDMSIVRGVHNDSPKRRLVDMLCKFAEAMGATVVGEGVEERAEADTLRDAGVHLLQGYFFGRPSLDAPAGLTIAA